MSANNPYMSEESKQNILLVHDAFWKALADRDVDKRFSYCSDFVTFIGSGLHEKAANREEYSAINIKGVEQYPHPFAMETLWLRTSLHGDMAWVESEIEWTLSFEGRSEKEMLRNTVVLKNLADGWKIIHVHGSMPDYRLTGQMYMTNVDTHKRNIELEQQVYHRTKELKEALDHLKATQTQLIQSEKMASLGELTAGIAHEIQNPLNFINNFSEVNAELIDEMKEELAMDNRQSAISLAENIKVNQIKITEHGKRADAIVKGMLQHSRSSSGVKEPTDINALADEFLRLAYHGLRAKNKSFNATMETNFDPALPTISVMPQDIGRVLLNLINNAFYAVNEKSKKGNGDYKPSVKVSTRKVQNGLEISVQDNGNGIAEPLKDKIFQPFFTTKPTGEGTGLGLSLSYDIVKAHGGELKVETKEGEGSVFVIHIPV